MTCVVFCGPSVPERRVRELVPNAVVLGPARCGDVYRASRRGATTIALIDGYFDHTLSVWHKELLWALSVGAKVYGAASMGALRGAELAPFGMIGVGEVFEQYRSSQLEDDDEVAVAHDEAERGYTPRSDAMVNLRATLAAACRAGAASEASCATLTKVLKQTFYPQRSLRLLQVTAKQLLRATDAEQLLAWIGQYGLVDQKRADAELLLRMIDTGEVAVQTQVEAHTSWTWVFEATDAWSVLRRSIDKEFDSLKPNPNTPRAGKPLPDEVLQWLNGATDGERAHVLAQATERALALLVANSNGASLQPEIVQKASEEFRLRLGLMSLQQTQAWLEDNGADLAAFSALIHDNLLREGSLNVVRSLVHAQLPNVLRLLGRYPRPPR